MTQDDIITMIVNMIDVWKECMIEYNPQYSTDETLGKVIELCERFDLDINCIKIVFDRVEEPYYYDIEKDEIKNSERDEEDEGDDSDDE